jgi:hypothetical protein
MGQVKENGKRIAPVDGAAILKDEMYAQKRMALISTAEKHADKKWGQCPGINQPEEREAWMQHWNQTFHSTMQQLYRKVETSKCPTCHGRGWV